MSIETKPEYDRIFLRSRNEPFNPSNQVFTTVRVDPRDVEYVRADLVRSDIAPQDWHREAARRIYDDVADLFAMPVDEARATDSFAAIIASTAPAAIGSDSAWPLRDVLNELIKWADHLRNSHNCDHEGYEVLLAAIDAAKPYMSAPAIDAEAAKGEIEKLRTRVWGTISGGNLSVRGYHDKGDVGTPNGEPWVVEEESGTHWSCYDVTFTPDADRIDELQKSVSRLYKQLEEKLENSALVKGLRAQLVTRYNRITELTAFDAEKAKRIEAITQECDRFLENLKGRQDERADGAFVAITRLTRNIRQISEMGGTQRVEEK